MVLIRLGAFDLGDEMEEHNVATLLKRYFRDMKEPIISYSLYGACIESANDHPQRNDYIQQTLMMLPSGNLSILQTLFTYLHRVHLNAEENLMNSKNLAIVFSPNLLRSQDLDPLLMIGTLFLDVFYFIIYYHR